MQNRISNGNKFDWLMSVYYWSRVLTINTGNVSCNFGDLSCALTMARLRRTDSAKGNAVTVRRATIMKSMKKSQI